LRAFSIAGHKFELDISEERAVAEREREREEAKGNKGDSDGKYGAYEASLCAP